LIMSKHAETTKAILGILNRESFNEPQ